MLGRCLTVTALLLLITSRAQAAQINLLLTVDYIEPTLGPRPISLSFDFIKSPVDGWKVVPNAPGTNLAHVGQSLLPGVTQFDLSLETSSLDDLYFKAWGLYDVFSPPPGAGGIGFYVAEPPTGYVSDGTALAYGAPWIPLANLGPGFSGDFFYVYGYPRTRGTGVVGSWQLTAAAAPDPVTPVPEPATLLLFGSGLAAIARKKFRQSQSE